MNDQLMRDMGFTDEVDEVKQGKCPICHKPINVVDFKDNLSWREYEISGMCQRCQDDTFKEE